MISFLRSFRRFMESPFLRMRAGGASRASPTQRTGVGVHSTPPSAVPAKPWTAPPTTAPARDLLRRCCGTCAVLAGVGFPREWTTTPKPQRYGLPVGVSEAVRGDSFLLCCEIGRLASQSSPSKWNRSASAKASARSFGRTVLHFMRYSIRGVATRMRTPCRTTSSASTLSKE